MLILFHSLYLNCHKYRVPFRMVDEINQGMDERNERLVFDRIVQSCCHDPSQPQQKPKPQYFLVTPKLLPAMRSMQHDDITVLMVYNGPGLQFDWVRNNPIFAAAKSTMAITTSSSSSSSSALIKGGVLGKRVSDSDHGSDEKKKVQMQSQVPNKNIPPSDTTVIKRELVVPQSTSSVVVKSERSQAKASSIVFEILDSDDDAVSKRTKRDDVNSVMQKENVRVNSSSFVGTNRGEVICID